ncbi:transglycosylase SLT domain-containing protein [Epibacterium sp. SM1979]|uniref:Transglycosylase SLT domain-containing protein n=1 Tax=Tritonibacter litoralis TaxID=2662264 RepID=A0A843YJ03_9RHOB|nr:lytic transglycosylase domain-containing protein [Tritonibacter litoralis]MQQ09414.1 transglycosylase SLT domain-containing protein [Tritonibacter litoralis]
MGFLRNRLIPVFLTAVLAVAPAPRSTAQSEPAAPKRVTPAPFPEFQSKTVRPPKAGAPKRSIVQITPEAAAETQQPQTDQTSSVVPARYGSFWQVISPKQADSGPGRLASALLEVSRQPGLSPPRLQDLQDMAAAYGVPLLLETVNTRVSPALALAVIAVESAGRADVTSAAGAQGVMQLTPETADRFGVQDPFDAAQNIAGGVKYLDWLMERFDGDPILVLAGYNAGAGAVRDHEGVPPYAETRDYVPKVLAAFQVARGLCKTPPELISDGCVFHVLK